MNIGLLVAGVVTGIVSIVLAAVRTQKLEDFLFIKPTLQSLEDVEKCINEKAVEKCPHCTRDFVEPYLNITVGRIELFGSLLSILSGFIAQAFLLLVNGNITTAISYFIYAALPGILWGRYLLEFKDVFFYWSRPWRFILGIVATVVGMVGSVDSFYFDIVGWIFNPWLWRTIGEFKIFAAQFLVVCIIAFVSFLIIRFYLNSRIPSLRTRILRYLKDHPEGYTIKGWHTCLDPTHLIWSEDDVARRIRELVYQGYMVIKMETRSSEPVYKAPD